VRPPLPRLHAITDERVARRPDLDRVVARLATAGADLALHARGRSLTGREHFDLAVRLSAHPPTLLFVNDRLDVALASDAAGVQLRHDSLPVGAARRLRSEWWIGRSVHSLAEARDAVAQRADYLVTGPMYDTTTHPGSTPLSMDTLRAIVQLGSPVIAIGGITVDRVGELRRAGVYGIAAIRALWDAPDPASAARDLLTELAERKS
jgi:thiazole tautomerase (transcriptional regulator TenI)